MKRSYLVAAILLIGVFAGTIVLAQSAGAGSGYDLSWHRIAGGGETSSSGGGYELGGTIGQHEAGTMSGGDYTLAGGFWGGEALPDPCPVPADLNCDGVVNVTDLLILLSMWGPCDVCADCPADLNGDCTVDVSDLLDLLSNWG